jgi:hypothetical protein
MSNNNNILFLPVSFGEAIDKLTILHIKLEKIKDNRKLDVQKEYDLLYKKLELFITEYNELYNSMKKVNLLIWNMMDKLRDENIDEKTYLQLCKETIEYNDIRFRIKNKINHLSNSLLKEQKSYKINRIIIDINNNIFNINDFIRPIKYYSLFYDELIIVHKKNSELLNEFKYDPAIIFLESITEKIENVKHIFSFKELNYGNDAILSIFNVTEEIINIIF